VFAAQTRESGIDLLKGSISLSFRVVAGTGKDLI
jgi:hypothetical protein